MEIKPLVSVSEVHQIIITRNRINVLVSYNGLTGQYWVNIREIGREDMHRILVFVVIRLAEMLNDL